jgi:hypothetical protein
MRLGARAAPHRMSLGLFLSIIVVFLTGTHCLAAPVSTTDGASAAQVLLREHQYSAALLHGDIKLLASVLSDSFVDTSASGVLRDKHQLLQIIARQKPPTSIRETARRIQIYGATAVVTVKFAVKGIDHGKAYAFTGRATDVWIRRGGAWSCIAAHSSAMG